jgi:hypothetical protein
MSDQCECECKMLVDAKQRKVVDVVGWVKGDPSLSAEFPSGAGPNVQAVVLVTNPRICIVTPSGDVWCRDI